jgi:hypothetical protein
VAETGVPISVSLENDPFNFDENELSKTNALQSSLWEIEVMVDD